MVERALRAIAIVTSLLIIVSFAMFAVNRLQGASRHQQAAVSDSSPSAGALPEPKHRKQPRRFIDGAAHTLLEPFAGLAPGHDPWVKRTIPTAVGLLLYGVGLGFLSRFARGRS
ncbi:MAG: hypothetical protein QOK31_1781 [Solirubrobacteraceae bacterium]|jgi:hypothetical protein|nr:hypothetical protein [Solirubrobacteraceae bacterium]